VGLVISFAASSSITQRASIPVESQRDNKRLTIVAISTVGLALVYGLALRVQDNFYSSAVRQIAQSPVHCAVMHCGMIGDQAGAPWWGSASFVPED
jgi:hypothetical protein